MEALRDMKLPPGFGFHPTDPELVSHYLKKKILGQKIEDDLIPEVDIYKHEPWDLPLKCNFPIKDNKWHFFAARDRKYPTGSRSNRATIAGYWKSTGKDRAIKQRNRTLGTKKTLVFHQGRPPSGKRTEWIMHEYYIDANECQANPDMKDAFVLCRVTKRTDWGLENDNEVGNRSPHSQEPNAAAATSVVSAENQEDAAAEEPIHVATPVASDELSNNVAVPATTPGSPNGDAELKAWLDALIDPSFAPDPDLMVGTGSTDLCLTENTELLNSQNLDSTAPKMEPYHASPILNGTDDTDYLLTGDIYSIFGPNTDEFNSLPLEPLDQASAPFATDQTFSMMGLYHSTLPNNLDNQIWKGESQLQQENNNPNPSNDNADNGIIIRRRNATLSASNMAPSGHRIRLQSGIKKMVTSNTESINQTLKFKDNNGHLDLVTDSERQRKPANDATPAKLYGGSKSSEDNSSQGYSRLMKNVVRCSAAGFNVFFAVCVIGVAAVVLHGHHRSGFSS